MRRRGVRFHARRATRPPARRPRRDDVRPVGLLGTAHESRLEDETGFFGGISSRRRARRCSGWERCCGSSLSGLLSPKPRAIAGASAGAGESVAGCYVPLIGPHTPPRNSCQRARHPRQERLPRSVTPSRTLGDRVVQAIERPFGVSVFGSAMVRLSRISQRSSWVSEGSKRRPRSRSWTRESVAAVRDSLRATGLPDESVVVSRVTLESLYEGRTRREF